MTIAQSPLHKTLRKQLVSSEAIPHGKVAYAKAVQLLHAKSRNITP